MGTIFFAGIYGVGKSTVINRISNLTSIRAYSAGDLISEKNGETYGANKVVANKDRNQMILIQQVSHLLSQVDTILLAGHFCIVNSTGKIEQLPRYVFDQIRLEKIVLLEAPDEVIIEHLKKRDEKSYPEKLIQSMLVAERQAAEETANHLAIPLIKYNMKYSEADATYLVNHIIY